MSESAVAIVDEQIPTGVEVNRAGVTGSGSLLLPSPEQLSTLQAFGEMYVKSGLLPPSLKTWQAVAVTIQHGMDLGIPISTAIQKIHVINGKPVCEAALMASLIYRDHGDDALRVIETDATRATVAYKRRSWTEYAQNTYTIEDAKRAELVNKPTWKQYPADMLRARCIAQIAHMQFQDTIGGLYERDEVDHLSPPSGGLGATVTPISREAAADLEREVIDVETAQLEPIDWETAVDAAVRSDQTPDQMSARVKDLIREAARRRDAHGYAVLIAKVPGIDMARPIYEHAHKQGLTDDSGIEVTWVHRQRVEQEQQEHDAELAAMADAADPVEA